MKTALYERHKILKAKMVDFCGWEMPLQYQGILKEHEAVRNNCGIFDVSHMGRVVFDGPDAEKFVDYLSTNRIQGKKDLTAIYTVISLPQGGSLDDVIIYKKNSRHFFAIVNAANREKDFSFFLNAAKAFDVAITTTFDTEGILAIQGPKSPEIVSSLFPIAKDLKKMHFAYVAFSGYELILSATGYTGEKGFEIYGPHASIVRLWDALINKGAVPAGLGARDLLRLEMGYALYGHELSETISANESVSAWAVKWDKDFLGKAALEQVEKSPSKRSQYGILLLEGGIAREGYSVQKEAKSIGKVTSGAFSPTLNRSIAIIMTDEKLKAGDLLEVAIRGRLVKAQVVHLPFIKN